MKNEERDPLGVGKYDEFTGGVVSDLDVVLDPSLVEPIETKTLSERLEIELNKQEVKGEEVIRQPKKWPVATDEQRDTAHEHDPAQFGHVEEGEDESSIDLDNLFKSIAPIASFPREELLLDALKGVLDLHNNIVRATVMFLEDDKPHGAWKHLNQSKGAMECQVVDVIRVLFNHDKATSLILALDIEEPSAEQVVAEVLEAHDVN
jgi:hypothetical protein